MMELVPNPHTLKRMPYLRAVIEYLRSEPSARRTVRWMMLHFDKSKQNIEAQMTDLMEGGIVERQKNKAMFGIPIFVYSICGSFEEIEALLHKMLMATAKPPSKKSIKRASEQASKRKSNPMSRAGQVRAVEASFKAVETREAKVLERQSRAVRSYSDLPREFFNPPVSA